MDDERREAILARRRKQKRRNTQLLVALTVVLLAIAGAGTFLLIQNISLANELQQFKDEQSQKNQEIEQMRKDLQAQIEALEGEKSGLETEKAKLQEEIDRLKKNIETLTSNKKIAYLTFDDGVSSNTLKILDILDQYGVKATFFPNWREGKENLYKEIVDRGHEIGNHTYSHDWKSVYSSVDGFKSEVESLNDKIEQATGFRPKIFRFPGGSNNTIHKKYNTNIIQPAIKALQEMGMNYCDWNVDCGDASSTKPLAPEKLVSNVLKDAGGKRAIVLMHDTAAKPTTVEALPQIIESLKNKGYVFSVLSEDVAPYQFVKPAA